MFGAMCSNGKGRNKPALIKQQWPLDKNECAFVAVLIWVCLGLRKHELESLFCKIQQIQIKRHIEELKMYILFISVYTTRTETKSQAQNDIRTKEIEKKRKKQVFFRAEEVNFIV